MRLFVALDLPEEIKEQLLDLNDESIAGTRWSGFDRFHLTLRFIGEVSGAQARDIDEALATVSADGFELALGAPGYFGDRRKARILWAGVTAPPALTRLQQKVERALQHVGLPAEQRKFRPHVTLARSKSLTVDTAERYCRYHSAFRTVSFAVRQFHLFSSNLTSDGAFYRIEADYPLRVPTKMAAEDDV